MSALGRIGFGILFTFMLISLISTIIVVETDDYSGLAFGITVLSLIILTIGAIVLFIIGAYERLKGYE
jgi:hypothetical protein